MNAETAVIERLYRALQRRDGAAMGACYHPQARFSDPVFPDLDAEGVRAMWAMLCARGKDLRVTFREIRGDAGHAYAHWEAWYTFSASGRTVHNVIDAEFELADGLILRQTDRFDFHRWAGQALGLAGWALGGTGFLQRKVRQQAAAGLAAWRAAAVSRR